MIKMENLSHINAGTCADMDQTCEWKCADKPVTAPIINTTTAAPPVPEKFCIGKGTDMFMNGFQVDQFK